MNHNETYELAKEIKGDAIYETSCYGADYGAWFMAYAYFPSWEYPFFTHGGNWHIETHSSTFWYNDIDGKDYEGNSFRVVLAP